MIHFQGVFYYYVVMKWVIVGFIALTIIYFIVRPEEKKVRFFHAF